MTVDVCCGASVFQNLSGNQDTHQSKRNLTNDSQLHSQNCCKLQLNTTYDETKKISPSAVSNWKPIAEATLPFMKTSPNFHTATLSYDGLKVQNTTAKEEAKAKDKTQKEKTQMKKKKTSH